MIDYKKRFKIVTKIKKYHNRQKKIVPQNETC